MNNIDERTGKPKIIYHLFADMGSDTLPYREAGYDVRCIGKTPGVENSKPAGLVYGVMANPPCTMFSIARTCAKTPRDLRKGMENVKEALRFIWECQYDLKDRQGSPNLKFWAIENPQTGYLKWFLGNPTYTYCPSEFGAEHTKRTALWGYFAPPLKPFFKFPQRKLIPLVSGGSRHDKKQWSVCYYDFAKAFFEANQ